MKHCEGTLKELWEDKDLVVNLFLLSIIWSITSFTFYLGKFQLNFVAGSIFRNSIFSSLADTVARPMGLLMYRKLNIKTSLGCLFAISTIGSFPVMFSENASEGYKDYVVPICLFTMNLGSSATFGNLYMGHMDLFPIVFSTTTMGICNIMARTLTVFAPIVAQIDQPTPEIIYTTLSVIGLIVTLFIRKKTNKYY